jgi:acyl-lipid omega-6 desaturase (Delta-12 desaturase)
LAATMPRAAARLQNPSAPSSHNGSNLTDALNLAVPTSVTAQNWTRLLAAYREPNHARSIMEIAITVGPFVLLWTLALVTYHAGYWWLSPLIAGPAAAFLVRLFMIQHDCGHGAFFRHRLANDWVGRVIGILTLTPYDFWRRTHAAHHASSGNLDHRGLGDINTLTVREYKEMSGWGRFCYRLYRHPFVLFGIGPAYLFVLQHRLPIGLLRGGWQPWLSTMATNLGIAVIVTLLIWFFGIVPFLLVHLPMTLIAGSIGVWLFYIQHQFNPTFWARDSEWTLHEAALYGSSYYHLPGILRWFTANIGMHHVHHLCSRIPYYRLPKALRDYPELSHVSRLTLRDSFRCVRLALWDEREGRLVSFRTLQAFEAA